MRVTAHVKQALLEADVAIQYARENTVQHWNALEPPPQNGEGRRRWHAGWYWIAPNQEEPIGPFKSASAAARDAYENL